MVFEVYIQKVAEWLETMAAQGHRIRIFRTPASVDEIRNSLPMRVGAGANPGIILREDTAAEIGNPQAGSVAFLLYTNDIKLIDDGKIILIGPDLPEAQGQSLPFGQLVILGGKALNDRDYENLKYAGLVGDRIEGYMVRSQSRNIWSRVSKAALAKGLNFESLGRALVALYKTSYPKIERMQVVFVTAGREALKPLEEMARQVDKISREIVRENWKIKGYDIDCLSDCSRCGDKAVCDEIKAVLAEKRVRDGDALPGVKEPDYVR